MRLLKLMVLVGLSAVLSGCITSRTRTVEKVDDPTKMALLKGLKEQSGLQLDPSTQLLFHEIDNERFIGLEQWILFSLQDFDLKSLPFTREPLLFENTHSLERMINARLPERKLEGPVDSLLIEWNINDHQYQADLLRTKAGNYLLVVLLPKNGS